MKRCEMNVSIKLVLTFTLIRVNLLMTGGVRLTVVTSEPLEFLFNHYQQLRNEGMEFSPSVSFLIYC